ncbi:hypothetical protein [Streptomyces sp. NBC_00842]|uniref:hypothetical protein n=1 Tax=Streptomyces sp. NBC_00842 TaxID=2975848 RepID=UPI00387035D0
MTRPKLMAPFQIVDGMHTSRTPLRAGRAAVQPRPGDIWATTRTPILVPGPAHLGQPDAPAVAPGRPGGMSAPIVVHGLSPSGGRSVAINRQTVGLAHSDQDLVEFLRRAGLDDAWDLLDDSHWIEWRGRTHHGAAATEAVTHGPARRAFRRIGPGLHRLVRLRRPAYVTDMTYADEHQEQLHVVRLQGAG